MSERGCGGVGGGDVVRKEEKSKLYFFLHRTERESRLSGSVTQAALSPFISTVIDRRRVGESRAANLV